MEDNNAPYNPDDCQWLREVTAALNAVLPNHNLSVDTCDVLVIDDEILIRRKYGEPSFRDYLVK